MVFDPAEPRTLYLASEYAGVQKSKDSGETFQPMNTGFTNHSLTQITGIGDARVRQQRLRRAFRRRVHQRRRRAALDFAE